MSDVDVVNEKRRRALTTPGERTDPARRGPGVLFASLAIHVVLVSLLASIIIVPFDFLRPPGKIATPLVVERIGFLALPRSARPSRERPRAGGDDRAPRPQQATPAPVVTPSTVPAAIPAPPKTATPEPGGSGAVVGQGGPTRGVRPEFDDPRIWAPKAPIVIAPMSPTQRLDSAIASRIHAIQDSLAALPTERAPGDWTTTRNGKKYGIDQKYIHLGDFSLPTAILALLPLNVQGNPSVYERDKRLAVMRGEIQEQAARMARDEDFRAAVKALRERKEKERQDEKKKAAEPKPDKIIPDLR
ncbi:MAG: hypothetical protein ACHQQ3_13560 [Gemmatimonadales bacterium]